MRSAFKFIFHQNFKSKLLATSVTGSLVGGYYFSKHVPSVRAETNEPIVVGERIPTLPTYSMAEVAKHTTKETGYWLAYKDGVYNVSSFVETHPGGTQILKTAGKALESCWKIFTIHQVDHVFETLEQYRIGNLPPGEREANARLQASQPNLFEYDPDRTDILENFVVRSQRPFNAETKPSHLVSSFITPVGKFYIRNHMHVPVVNINEYKLEISHGNSKFSLTYDDLIEKYKSHTITSALQCAGNRRHGMNDGEHRAVRGTQWYVGAIGNARWTGVRLRDVLQSCGLDKKGKHVQFFGLDCDSGQKCYGASIPMEKAMSEDVLLVYEMNDEILTRDHGYPLRVFIPGTVGARSVKWISRIIVSDQEADSHWQKSDYKIIPSSIKEPQQVDYDKLPALQESNVQSAICHPSVNEDGNKVHVLSVTPSIEEIKEKKLTIKGYALGGGGRKVQSVEISFDHGKTWFPADLNQLAQPYMSAWAWTLWTCHVPFDKIPNMPLEIVCRAMDTHVNSQPDTTLGIWNISGLMNNSWHKIKIQIDENYLKR